MDEAFEAWFKELYIREGFVSSKAELYAAWRAASLSEREACAAVCDLNSADYTREGSVICARDIRAR